MMTQTAQKSDDMELAKQLMPGWLMTALPENSRVCAAVYQWSQIPHKNHSLGACGGCRTKKSDSYGEEDPESGSKNDALKTDTSVDVQLEPGKLPAPETESVPITKLKPKSKEAVKLKEAEVMKPEEAES